MKKRGLPHSSVEIVPSLRHLPGVPASGASSNRPRDFDYAVSRTSALCPTSSLPPSRVAAMKLTSIRLVLLALVALARSGGLRPWRDREARRRQGVRPNCKALLPIAKVEEVVGGTVTLEHFGKSDFIRNALTPGTEAGTECVYATTEETQNDYGIAGTVSTAFAETPKQWNAYRASAKKYPGLEATTFQPVKLGGGNQSFVLRTDIRGRGTRRLLPLRLHAAPQHVQHRFP